MPRTIGPRRGPGGARGVDQVDHLDVGAEVGDLAGVMLRSRGRRPVAATDGQAWRQVTGDGWAMPRRAVQRRQAERSRDPSGPRR
jgi:hypothetical protein